MANIAPWPLHPQPYDDELFSSWITRAAHANAQKVSTLFAIAAPEQKNITKNIDGYLHEKYKERFAQYLKTPLQQVESTFLTAYEGNLFETTTIKSKRKLGILFTGAYSGHREHLFWSMVNT